MVSSAPNPARAANPLLALDYVPAFAALGDDYSDPVGAAPFPQHILRFRNDAILRQIGLAPQTVSDEHVVQAFGRFEGREPFLAMRYHGYQFGEYNSFLGDGRGFLYGQVHTPKGDLYDLGTKGSGTTPYSRGGDGRLTLKGGVREVLAAEALHALGVTTSRTLSLVETGESLWRGDEPSPTRSSVMVRFSRSHIRFGTFERLEYLQRPDLIAQLLDHVIELYYPGLCLFTDQQERFLRFYDELTERVADLASQWMAAGFCHAVLNTDNMAITGESFDYGPYAFMDQYNPRFTAAYFDYAGRYSYGNQPMICQMNLQALQKPLKLVMPTAEMEPLLVAYKERYLGHYYRRMAAKLGLADLDLELAAELVTATLAYLEDYPNGYPDFFRELTQAFTPSWRSDVDAILNDCKNDSDGEAPASLRAWRQVYHRCLNQLPATEMGAVGQRLRQTNPAVVLLRPQIEAVWEPIVEEDNWQPFYDLLGRVQQPFTL